jgi:predicted nucleic acid-binding protein
MEDTGLMLKQKIYIESTVWYQLVNYSSSEFKERAAQLFMLIDQDKYEIYISNIVLEEIALNGARYRKRLEEIISKYKPLVLFQNEDTELLASAYMENAYKTREPTSVVCDALHAAIATVSNISYMVSYNYRHLLNIEVLEHINSVNLLGGYNRSLNVLPPFMFLHLENYDGEKGSVDAQVWEIKNLYGKKLFELEKKDPEGRILFHKRFTNRMMKKLNLQTVNIHQKVSYL